MKMLVSVASPIAKATINTAGASLIATPTHAGVPLATLPSLRLRVVAHPETTPMALIAPPPHVFHVKTHSGTTSTSTHAVAQPTHVSRMPADARDIHSRS